MATNEKQKEYAKRHQKKLYRIPVYIPQEIKSELEDYSTSKGHQSLNAYIKALIEADSGIGLTKKV